MMCRITLPLWIVIFLWGGYLLRDLYAQDPQSPPESALEHYYQGVFYGKQGKYVEAITELEKAIELQPAYADAYNALGVVYHLQKEYQEAIEQYLLAVEADPRHVKAHTNLAMVYNEQKEYRKAVRQLEKALEIDPNYEPARNLIDEVRRKADEQDAKELERQQKEAKRVAQPQPEQTSREKQKPAKSFFDSGTALIKQGKIEAGIREYQKGLELQPHSAEGYTLLGMAYREKYRTMNDGKWRQEEISSFNKALQYDPKYVPALLSLGEVLYEQGEIAKAIPYFQKVLRYAPNHPAKAQLEAIIGQTQ
jgi:tetratricopeptide (TPR) repeat protein